MQEDDFEWPMAKRSSEYRPQYEGNKEPESMIKYSAFPLPAQPACINCKTVNGGNDAIGLVERSKSV